MAGTLEISTINMVSPNGLIEKNLTINDSGTPLFDGVEIAKTNSPTFTGDVVLPSTTSIGTIDSTEIGYLNGVTDPIQGQFEPRTVNNWIINGQFDVWQRGTSQTSNGYGSDDRWQNINGTSTKTHSQQAFAAGQTDVPNNPAYFSRTVVTSAGTTYCFVVKRQLIEDVTKFAGKTVTLSFWAKADSNKSMALEFWQDFGFGGSSAVNFGIQKLALTTSWQRFTKTLAFPSISGKTIVTGSYSEVAFWFDAGSDFNARTDSLGNQSGTFDIANVCLVEGSVPVECPNEPYAEVLRKCQRYYYRINSIAPTTSCVLAIGNAFSTSLARFHIPFPTAMRTHPTSIEYGGTIEFCDLGGGSGVTLSAIAIESLQSGITSAFITAAATTASLTQYRQMMLQANNYSYIAIPNEL